MSWSVRGLPGRVWVWMLQMLQWFVGGFDQMSRSVNEIGLHDVLTEKINNLTTWHKMIG